MLPSWLGFSCSIYIKITYLYLVLTLTSSSIGKAEGRGFFCEATLGRTKKMQELSEAYSRGNISFYASENPYAPLTK